MDLSRWRFGQILTALGFAPGLRGIAGESGPGPGSIEPVGLRLERNS